MAKKEEVYSSLYDLIFSSKRSRGGTPIEGVNVSGLSGVAKGLAEMAAYPSVYPADKLMSDFNFQVDLATNAKFEPIAGKLKYEVGAGSILSVFANPKKFLDKAWSDYEEGKRNASLSAGLKYLDGAKFTIAARKYGIGWKDALGLGFSIADSSGIGLKDLIKKDATGKASTNRGKFEDVTSRRDRITGLGTGLGAGRWSEGTMSALDRGLTAEFDAALRYFETSNGIRLSDSEKESIRSAFRTGFRSTSSFASKSQRRSEFRNILDNFSINIGGTRYTFNDRIKKDLVDGVWGAEASANASPQIQQLRGDDYGYFSVIKDDDPSARLRFASVRSEIKNLSSIIDSTSDPVLKNKLIGYRKLFIDYVSGRKIGLPYSLGASIGTAIYTLRWVDGEAKGKFLASFLTGGLFDFKNDIFKSGFLEHFSKGYEKVSHGRYFTENAFFVGNKKNVLGKFADAYYYYHPINIIKGLFWDGRTWKKLQDLNLVRPEIAARIIKLMPNEFLQRVIKGNFKKAYEKLANAFAVPLKNVLSRFASTFIKGFDAASVAKLPLRQLVQQIVQKLIMQIAGSTVPVVGNIAAFIADAVVTLIWNITEKVLKPLLEFMVLIVLGMISLVILGISGLGLWGRETLAQPYLNEPVSYTSGQLVYGPIDFNFNISTGAINCNQTLPDQHVNGVLSKSEYGSLADRWAAGTNYADECYNDVICRAKSKGVDPAFALLIWANESGASNYDVSNLPVQDFGINNGSTPAEDFNAQIEAFMALSHEAACPGLDYWTAWATKYLTGTCDITRVVNGITGPEYLEGIRERYQWVRPGYDLPAKIKDSSLATGQMCVGIGGSIYSNYSGEGMPYGGGVLTGTPAEIWNKALAEFGINAGFQLVYPGSTMYESTIGPGAWCFSGSGTIYCKADKINSASDALLSGLFRHEIAHQVQHSNGSFSNWESRHREWGAEHLSGNGGNYMFRTSDGYCMRGLQVSQKLLDSGSCSQSDLSSIAKGNALSGSSCSSYLKSYITGASIGSSCR